MSLPAAEVAADFRDALQDLRMNSRPEISNLTLIAKENTEYAEAISTELQNHIRSTRPEWKLPALYVLDSIVKNVGTPYTVYLGRQLYKTFMDAYLVMSQEYRKAMEGLLRTWKLPVPESMDTRPVFPSDVTGDIENALNKMRAMQLQQQAQRPQHALPPRPPTSNVAWKNTPTPPQNVSRYAAPNDPRTRPAGRPSVPPSQQYSLPAAPPTIPYNLPVAPPTPQFSFPGLPPTLPPSFPYNTTSAPPMPGYNTGMFQPDTYGSSNPSAPAIPPYNIGTPQPEPPKAATPSLADLLKMLAPTPATNVSATPPFYPQQSSTPVAVPPPFFPLPTPTPVSAPVPALPLPPVVPAPLPAGPAPSLKDLLAQLSQHAPAPTATPVIPAAVHVPGEVELTTASLKIPRLHLIDRLYDTKPNICATCGRRFENTQEGKEKKARHMDWHFRVKDPDAAKRGIHRSWYIPEKEWIEYREIDETAPPSANGVSSASGAAKPKRAAKDRYVSSPQDAALQQAPCPICQEKFETVWNVDANDFVWMDAINVGGKIYHATCFEEYSRSMGMEMPGTPDSVLGKRKADVGTNGEGKKLRGY